MVMMMMNFSGISAEMALWVPHRLKQSKYENHFEYCSHDAHFTHDASVGRREIHQLILKNCAKLPPMLHFINNCLCIVRVWIDLIHKLATTAPRSLACQPSTKVTFYTLLHRFFACTEWIIACDANLRDWRQHHSFHSQNVQICHVRRICNKNGIELIFIHFSIETVPLKPCLQLGISFEESFYSLCI